MKIIVWLLNKNASPTEWYSNVSSTCWGYKATHLFSVRREQFEFNKTKQNKNKFLPNLRSSHIPVTTTSTRRRVHYRAVLMHRAREPFSKALLDELWDLVSLQPEERVQADVERVVRWFRKHVDLLQNISEGLLKFRYYLTLSPQN